MEQRDTQDYAEFTDEDGNFCQIWLENEASIEEKMKLVQEYGLAGVAEWKLGFERSSIWVENSEICELDHDSASKSGLAARRKHCKK